MKTNNTIHQRQQSLFPNYGKKEDTLSLQSEKTDSTDNYSTCANCKFLEVESCLHPLVPDSDVPNYICLSGCGLKELFRDSSENLHVIGSYSSRKSIMRNRVTPFSSRSHITS